MNAKATDQGGVRKYTPARMVDERGWFVESYSMRTLAAMGIVDTFVQDNHSYSASAFALRGLHLQRPPHAQAKLVRCLRGRIYDVVVDVRAGSPTYGHWQGTTLSAAAGDQLYVPVGFAHGFLTLEDGCEVAYKCTALYERAAEDAIHWHDPDLAIDWPIPPGVAPLVGPKDDEARSFNQFTSAFVYQGMPLTPID